MSSDGRGDLRVRVATSLKAVPAADWNACANPHALDDALVLHDAPALNVAPAAAGGADAPAEIDRDNPFVSYAFLSALEDSGCVGGRSGWAPAYLLVEDGAGTLLAAAPSFLKSHSQGEYVFDHAWADAYERAGGHYYPKLQVAAPFTPATGPRLLVAEGPRAAEARAGLIAGLEALRDQAQASSVHATFAQEPDIAALREAGYLERNDLQFHWRNEGFGSYDDFLATLASRKRKALKRERREALAHEIEVEVLSGPALTEAVWDDFHSFYEDTGSRKWGRPYLNRAFFSAVGAAMGERIVLVMARRAGRYIAGAINFRGANTLYGRNWGCVEDHPFLHFELCYHRAIDYAIAHKLVRVEAGAQGEHKIARGYRPVITRSMHHLADPGLRRAVSDYLKRERRQIAAAQEALAAESPFRKGGEA